MTDTETMFTADCGDSSRRAAITARDAQLRGDKPTPLRGLFTTENDLGRVTRYGAKGTGATLIPVTLGGEGTPLDSHEALELPNGLVVPGMRAAGVVKTVEVFRYERIPGGDRVLVEAGERFEVDGLTLAVHSALVRSQAEGTIAHESVCAIQDMAREHARKMLTRLLRSQEGWRESGFALTRPGLKDDCIYMTRKRAKKIARRLGVESIEGLVVLVKADPGVSIRCLQRLRVVIVENNAIGSSHSGIWLSSKTMEAMGRDCDGDVISIGLPLGPQVWGAIEEIVSPFRIPLTLPEGTLSLETIKASPDYDGAEVVKGMTKTLQGPIWNGFQRLALLASVACPTAASRAALCVKGNVSFTEADLADGKWCAFITIHVSDTMEVLSEAGFDMGKEDADKDFEKALRGAIDVLQGKSDSWEIEADLARFEKSGRAANVALVNAILKLIPADSTLTKELGHYMTGVAVGKQTDKAVTRLMVRIHEGSTDAFVAAINGQGTDTRACFADFKAEQGRDEEAPKPRLSRPAPKPSLGCEGWAHICSVVNAILPTAGLFYAPLNAKRQKGDLLRLRTSFGLLSVDPWSFTASVTGDDGHTSRVLASKGQGTRIAPQILRSKVRNLADLDVLTEQGLIQALPDEGAFEVVTLLDLIGEAIALALAGAAHKTGAQQGVNDALRETVMLNSFAPGQHGDEVIDGEIALHAFEYRVEVPSHGTARGQDRVYRRAADILSKMTVVDAFNPEVTHRLDVGVTSKSDPLSVVTIVPSGARWTAVEADSYLVPGNRRRQRQQARTNRLARTPLNRRVPTCSHGEEGGTGVDKQFVEAVIVAMPGYGTLNGDDAKIADMGACTLDGAVTFARHRVRTVYQGSRAVVEERIAAFYDVVGDAVDGSLTIEDAQRLGWRVDDTQTRYAGSEEGEALYTRLYTVTSPEVRDEPTIHKLATMGHRFMAPIVDQHLAVKVGGAFVPVDALIAEETIVQKKLGTESVAQLCAFLGRTDFRPETGVDFDSLKADASQRLSENGLPASGRLPLYSMDGDTPLLMGDCFPMLARTFILHEDEALAEHSQGGDSFRRLALTCRMQGGDEKVTLSPRDARTLSLLAQTILWKDLSPEGEDDDTEDGEEDPSDDDLTALFSE